MLDRGDVIAATTSSRDVDTAKPEPGIMRVALDRAGVDAARAVFVGDAAWDAHAAAGAGLPCIGLLSGGVSRAELHEAARHPCSPMRRTSWSICHRPESRPWSPAPDARAVSRSRI